MFSLQVAIVNKRELGCGLNQGSYITGFQHGHCMEVNFWAYMCASWLIKLEKRIALISCWREENVSLHSTYSKSLTGQHPALKTLDWKYHCFWNQTSVKPKTTGNWCTGNGQALWPPNVRWENMCKYPPKHNTLIIKKRWLTKWYFSWKFWSEPSYKGWEVCCTRVVLVCQHLFNWQRKTKKITYKMYTRMQILMTAWQRGLSPQFFLREGGVSTQASWSQTVYSQMIILYFTSLL